MVNWKHFLGDRNQDRDESPGERQLDSSRPSVAVVRAEGSSGLRHIQIRDFQLLSDTGPDFAGFDLGPTPFELQLGALGSCLTQTFLVQAAARGIELGEIEIEVAGNLRRPPSPLSGEPSTTEINYTVHVSSPASQAELARLLTEVERASPICQLISNPRTVQGSVIVDRGPSKQASASLN